MGILFSLLLTLIAFSPNCEEYIIGSDFQEKYSMSMSLVYSFAVHLDTFHNSCERLVNYTLVFRK